MVQFSVTGQVRKLVFAIVLLNLISISKIQAQEFSVKEISHLFKSERSMVFETIQDGGYSYTGKDMEFDEFFKHTLLGDYHLTLCFKNSKLSNIGYEEVVARGYGVIQDLTNSNYTYSDRNIDERFTSLYVGSFYRFDNFQTGMMCTILRAHTNQNALFILFGKIPKNEMPKKEIIKPGSQKKIVMPAHNNF